MTDSFGNETSVIRTVNVVDTTNPIVTLIGDSEVTIEVFGTYDDLGITKSDNSMIEPTLEIIGEVNYNVVGEYIITYTVTDSFGNETSVIRTINVVDTEVPILTLLPGIDTVFIGEEYIDPFIDFTDNYSTVFDTVTDNTVDTSILGEYIIQYTVRDEYLNESIIYRYVNVVEKEVVVQIKLDETINTIKTGEEFIPAVCIIVGEYSEYSDDCRVDLTDVDMTAIGTYEVVYFVEINSIRYEKISYVFVYNEDDSIVWYYDKSRRGYL